MASIDSFLSGFWCTVQWRKFRVWILARDMCRVIQVLDFLLGFVFPM